MTQCVANLLMQAKSGQEQREQKLVEMTLKIERSKSILNSYNKEIIPMFKPLEEILSKNIVNNLIKRSKYINKHIGTTSIKEVKAPQSQTHLSVTRNMQNIRKLKIISEAKCMMPSYSTRGPSPKAYIKKIDSKKELGHLFPTILPRSRISMPYIAMTSEENEDNTTQQKEKPIVSVKRCENKREKQNRNVLDTLNMMELRHL